jgi:signal transduction histidine kinase
MTLRRRLFLLVALVVCLLLVGETLLVRSLARELDAGVRAVAVELGEDLLSGFEFRVGDEELPRRRAPGSAAPSEGGAPGAEAGAGARRESEVVLHRKVWQMRAPGDPAVGAFVVRDGEAVPEVEGEAPRTFVAEERVERFTLVPGERDLLFLRGPQVERHLRIPSAPVASTVERFESRLVTGSLALLAIGLLTTALLVGRATRPLGELERAARRVGEGELGVEIPVRRSDEVGAAVAAFNAMSGRLAALDRENRRLADAEHLSELGEVARGLAHTLRNPLNALGLAVERLAEERDGARAGELAEGCRRQIRRLDASLRSFLALASAPAAAAEPVDLATLAREVALEAAQDAAGRVRVEVDAPEPVALPGVGAELKAALQALVVNACEASPDDGRVVLRVRRDGGADDAPVERARIEVEDEGAGIAPEVAARLFAPHVTTKPHGSGMGLFLAHRLAGSRYGGSLELTARSPRGTRAVLRLARRELPRRPETAS